MCDDAGADPTVPSALGSLRPDLAHLTPMQLAAYLGDYRMLTHCMRRRAVVLWKWGPVTQYQLDLDEIESVGSEGRGVMALAANASPELLMGQTRHPSGQELSMLHDLFMQKWETFARSWFWWLRLVDMLYLALLATLAILCKLEYGAAAVRPLAALMLIVAVILITRARTTAFADNFAMAGYLVVAASSTRLLWLGTDSAILTLAPLAAVFACGTLVLLQALSIPDQKLGMVSIMVQEIILQVVLGFLLPYLVAYLVTAAFLVWLLYSGDLQSVPLPVQLFLMAPLLLLACLFFFFSGDTYSDICEKSQGSWRANFARLVLQIEAEQSAWLALGPHLFSSLLFEKLFEPVAVDMRAGVGSNRRFVQFRQVGSKDAFGADGDEPTPASNASP